MAIIISPKIRDKLLEKHNVTPEEVDQCFANRNGEYILQEVKGRSATVPTYWFIAETNYGRKLKVAFVEEHGNIYLCTAFDASQKAIQDYMDHGGGVI